ncbi:MAG TPA: hypothetical protein VK957_17310 [Lunatimonas sp.]|nr:hypothetical protein [Lunatimonas sp.]
MTDIVTTGFNPWFENDISRAGFGRYPVNTAHQFPPKPLAAWAAIRM